jgi:alanyl-tRNA synthetase
MTSKDVRNTFLKFFESRGHRVVSSAPIVVKDDPTLMFTNAGMNQFKDYFLGTKNAEHGRIANTQKCLRVSGKHNDLEEVGVDTYHHTMFEMLGNWSFGDYFKEEAIAWAWELLTEVYGLDQSRLYVTIFGGDKEDALMEDQEAKAYWEKIVPADRILPFGKKDNFWEMGDVGPCGPCSEIHMDLRSDEDRKLVDGKDLVNQDHEQVIELWNLVFIQYNRQSSGALLELPAKHIDTGMGLERIVRAINGQNSNYQIDGFKRTIAELEKLSEHSYGSSEAVNIAFRVIADHVRALAFCIADGQLPSNTGAGYVLRRILRRAVRYGYSFLGFKEAFMYKLIPDLSDQFFDIFPELKDQEEFLQNVMKQEEMGFFRTLFSGLDRLGACFTKQSANQIIDGRLAFELYDTYGFPIDLTELIAKEKGWSVEMSTYYASLEEQKTRSRADATRETGDWTVLRFDDHEEFIGYDYKSAEVRIARYRSLKIKGKVVFQLVFDLTPFYAESGGQVGDTGSIIGKDDLEVVTVVDTQKENDLIVHVVDKLPANPAQSFTAKIDEEKQELTARNHSATHLLHAALKKVLGDHVAQRGSLVNPERLRFDFSHFAKVSQAELLEIESIVNAKIREAIPLTEKRNYPYTQAISDGVTALFGEKYGDTVRVISFDTSYSNELCGGIHVKNTTEIGMFKVVSESSISAGVRRIEAITSRAADNFIHAELQLLDEVRAHVGNADLIQALVKLKSENAEMKKRLESFSTQVLNELTKALSNRIQVQGDFEILVEEVELQSAADAKDICFRLGKDRENLFCFIAANVEGVPSLSLYISESLVASKGWNAGTLIREFASHIQGGGGGQAFFAQAGGKDVNGIDGAVKAVKQWLGDAIP